MTSLVLDASVVIKWLVPEIHSDAARMLLDRDCQYLAPDLLFAEIANIVWKKVSRGELLDAQGRKLLNAFEQIAVETVPCRALAGDAYALAALTRRSAYDAMYLALAIRLDTRMITADERLAKSVAAIPQLARHIQSLQRLGTGDIH